MGKSSKLIKGLILGAKAFSKDRSTSSHDDKEQSKKAKSRWSLGKPYVCVNHPADNSDRESDTRSSVEELCEDRVACTVNDDVKSEITVTEPIEENADSICLSAPILEELADEQGVAMDDNGISTEEHAAVVIQAAFRGFLCLHKSAKPSVKICKCRRAFGALKDRMRVEAETDEMVRKQTAMTLKCIQALVKVQARVRARQVRMSAEGQAVQRHIREKHQLRAFNGKSEEDWDHSTATFDELQAKLQNKQDAAMRRERALAYAFSQQLRICSPKRARTAVDPNQQQLGRSWLERWMACHSPDNAGLEDDILNAYMDANKIDKSLIHGKFQKKKTDPTNLQPVLSRDFESFTKDHKGCQKFLIGDENKDNENVESCGTICSSPGLAIKCRCAIAKAKDANKLRIPNYMSTTQSSKAKIHQV